jgi:hypothetical protein
LSELLFEHTATPQKQACFFRFESHAAVECILLTRVDMEREGRKGRKDRFGFAGFAGFALLTLSTPALAQNASAQPPHVRGEGGMQRLVDGAAQRSSVIREWIDRLEELDVTVYVRARVFTQLDLEGRVGLLSAAGGHRFLLIELSCGRSELSQMATLGHELFHAIEIAEDPSVVSAATLADLYSRIGVQTGDYRGRRTFETEAAAAAGRRARRQLLSTRTGHGT